jgi:hypothetical protein
MRIGQAEVAIHDHNPQASLMQSNRKVGRQERLAGAPLAAGERDDGGFFATRLFWRRPPKQASQKPSPRPIYAEVQFHETLY